MPLVYFVGWNYEKQHIQHSVQRTEDIVKIEARRQIPSTREQGTMRVIIFGKKVTSVSSYRHLPWVLKHSQESGSLTYVWMSGCVTEMHFRVKAGMIPVINMIHSHKTQSMRIFRVQYKYCITIIFLYHSRAARTASVMEKRFTMSS